MRRIICVGNRYRREDAAGPAVHDHLAACGGLPAGVELIDGGLGGLDLLRWVDGAARVVFVDSVSGMATAGAVITASRAEVASLASPHADHAAGLPYLLRCLPQVCEGALPEVTLVGIEGEADDAMVARAAALALRLVSEDRHGRAPAAAEVGESP